MEATVRRPPLRPLRGGVALLAVALLVPLILSAGAARAAIATLAASKPSRAAAADYRETRRWITGDRPGPIAVGPKGRVLVEVDEKLETYTSSGRRLGSFATGVSSAYGLAVGRGGEIYLSEYGGVPSAVHVFDRTGRSRGAFTATDDEAFSPWGLEVNPSNGQLWIVNTIGPSIERANPSAPSLGSHGTGNGQFDNPTDIAYGGGSMYVADTDNHRIQRFDAATGAFQRKWGQAGFRRGQLDQPTSLAVGRGGVVLVLDEALGLTEIDAFSPQGRYLGTSRVPATNAFALATDKKGNAYVTGLLDYPRGGWGVVRLSPRSMRR